MTGPGDDKGIGSGQDDRPDVLADIPWERFAEHRGIAGLRPLHWVLVAAGVALFAVLGWWIAQGTAPAQGSPSVSSPSDNLASVTATSTPSPSTVADPPTTVTPSPTVGPSTTQPGYDDLMAGPLDRVVLVTAEWYVRRYFTDPVAVGLEERRRAHYVEWASTRSVTHLAPGLVEVEVLVQTLIESDVGYRRQGVQSVVVPLWASGAGWEVADLPSQVKTVDLELAELPEPTQPLPPDLGARVAQATGGEVSGGGRVDDRWRVELLVKGLPVVMWVDDDGNPTDPPRRTP